MAPKAPAAEGSIEAERRLDSRVLWTLLAGNALTSIGVGFFLPILPLFMASRGSSPVLVGTVFAAGVAAKALVQYPAGWLADRYGKRPLLVLGLLVYALLFPLYLLPFPVAALVGVRFVHALAGGTVSLAATALVADLTLAERRGKAFGQLRASDETGLLLGPALGGLVAGFRLDAVFVGAALVCLLAVPLMLRLPEPRVRRTNGAEDEPPVSPWHLLWRILPVAVLGAPVFWTFGTYDSIWSLYITSRGATPLLVGLSFSTYALPIVLFGGLAGGLSDRIGAVRAGTLALVTYGLLAATYPFVASVPFLILIGFLEGTLTAAGNPALMGEVSRLAPPGAQGRTQGVYSAVLNVAQVVGAVAAGALYARGPAYAFLGATTVCLVGAAASVVLRRSVEAPPRPRPPLSGVLAGADSARRPSRRRLRSR